MKAVIADQIEDEAGYTVRFTCSFGMGTGAWKGRNAPVPGTVHDLEFDVMPQLEIGTNASIVEGKEHSIRTDGNRNWLVGTIEAIDPDGMAHLRLAVDCLTMVEGNDNDVELGSQVKFTVEAKDLWIYPIGA